MGLDTILRPGYDYGYQQTGTITPIAKSILTSFYGISPVYSYYLGCSNGGREAMVASQRWGDMFDGIVAGDPGFRLPHAAIAEAWDTQQFAQAALAVGTTHAIAMGTPTFPPPQASRTWRLWRNSCFRRVIRSMDCNDKMIFNTAACQQAFNPASHQPASVHGSENPDLLASCADRSNSECVQWARGFPGECPLLELVV